MWTESGGDLGMYLALVALRRIEAGSAGREFGVLSVSAPNFAMQLQVAHRSLGTEQIRQRSRRPNTPLRDRVTGCFTDDFLRQFSARWAPPGAANDPGRLNDAHADNLVRVHALLVQMAVSALTTLPGGSLEHRVSTPA